MSRRCTAKAKTTGERCRRRPHPGATVCIVHGAGAPQVQRTARERLNELVLPAIATLHDALASGDLVRIWAPRDILGAPIIKSMPVSSFAYWMTWKTASEGARADGQSRMLNKKLERARNLAAGLGLLSAMLLYMVFQFY